MAELYISVILVFRVVQAVFSKRASNEVKNLRMMLSYIAFAKAISAVLGLLLIIVAANGFKADLKTVVIAAFSGFMLFASSFCSVYAMKSGTISLSSMFSTAGMIIPVIAGAVLFDKPVGVIQLAGLGLFFVSAWLLIGSSREIYKGFSIKTLMLLIGSLVANGGTMLAQQMFTAYVPKGDVSVFSFLSFAIISLLSAVAYKAGWLKTGEAGEGKLSKKLIVCAVALAVAVFVINQLATISTTLVSPVILFTFINGGGTIISTVVAAIMYKERISAKSAAGIALGITSLVIIKLFEV